MLPGLQNYFTEFVPEHLPLPGGKARGRRSAQKLAKKHNLPLIRIGKITLIDIELAAQRLREAAMTPPRDEPRRGRPPKSSSLKSAAA